MGERCVARTHAKECIPLLMSSVLPLTPMCTVGQRQPPGSRGGRKKKEMLEGQTREVCYMFPSSANAHREAAMTEWKNKSER